MKIGIIGAMEEEVEILSSLTTNSSIENIANHKYLSGKLGKHEVVITQSGIGKVCAASAAIILAHHFKVDAIINTGCAGGIGAEMKIGDIALSTGMAYHDFDLTAFNRPRGQVPQYETIFKSDENLRNIALKAAQNLKQSGNFAPNVYTGIILTGDQFIADKQKCLDMLKDFPQALVTEMEGAAIAHVCTDFNIPCLVIRSASDNAQGEGPELFEQFVKEASDNSAKLLVSMLNEDF